MTEPQALGRAAKRRGKARPPGDLDSPGAMQAPAASVLAPADLEQGRIKPPAGDPLTMPNVIVVCTYFFLGVILYTGYFGTNADALDEVSLPWSISAVQQVIGSALIVLLWVFKLRPVPRLTMTNIKAIAPIAVCHTLSHMFTAIGLGGDHSYYYDTNFAAILVMPTHPLFNTLFSAIFLKHTFSRWVYPALVLVIAGGALMFVEPPDYYWSTMVGVIGFNLAASMCTILAKRSMGMDMGGNMSPVNLYGVVAILSLAMFLPVWIIMEGSAIEDLWEAYCITGQELAVLILSSGVFLHFYNDVTFRCLGHLHPMTHAVGSILKHAYFLAVSTIDDYAYYELTGLAFMGSGFATAGVLLYILAETVKALPTQREGRAIRA